MKWITSFFTSGGEENNPISAITSEAQDKSSLAQRTDLLAKIKRYENISKEEIQEFQKSGGDLNSIINKETNENLMDRAIKLNNTNAIEALKERGAKPEIETTHKAIMIKEIKNPIRERSNSGYTTADMSSRSSSRSESPTIDFKQEEKSNQQTSPVDWNKANPNAATDADKARATKIEDLEKNKNKPIARPKKSGAEVAAEMEAKLKVKQETAQSENRGKIDFSKMKKVARTL
jgi:hypothetical protein